MSSETLIKKGPRVNELLTAILLPPEIAVIKIEVHTKKTEIERQGNLANFHAETVTMESVKVTA